MYTKADRPECECRAELREHEVRSNSVLTRNACREVRSNSGITRKAREKCEAEEQAPPSPLAPLHKFCYYIQMCCDVFLHRPRHKQEHGCGGC